jgi:hypothetical protein
MISFMMLKNYSCEVKLVPLVEGEPADDDCLSALLLLLGDSFLEHLRHLASPVALGLEKVVLLRLRPDGSPLFHNELRLRGLRGQRSDFCVFL